MDLDHWALYKKIRQDSYDALHRKLIYSIRTNTQVATILMANGDAISNHCLSIKQATATTAHGAFTPVRVRDMFQLGPKTTVLPELDPKNKGLLFPDLCQEDPYLESIIGDEVSREMKVRILAEVQRSQTNNHWMVRLLDAKAKSLYSSAIGLVNDGVKPLKRFGKVQQALDTCQMSVLREC